MSLSCQGNDLVGRMATILPSVHRAIIPTFWLMAGSIKVLPCE